MTNRSGPRRAAFCGAALAAATLVLTGCGTDQPVTPRTTTVTVTPSTPSGSPSSSPPPTSTTTTTTTAVSQPPATYDQALQHVSAGKVDTTAKPVFTSPTGNIFCAIATTGPTPAGCELRDGRVQPPAGTCPTNDVAPKDVGRIEWQGDVPMPLCNSDSMYQPGAQVLQYGAVATANGSPIRCVSEMIGMTCVDTASKKGFFIAKGVYAIF